MDKVLWKLSYSDLKKQVALKVQFQAMDYVQQQHLLREVVAEALGTKTKAVKEKPPESFSEIAQIISSAGGAVH